MLPEHHIIFDSYYVERVIRVVLLQMHQNFKLNTCLVLKSFLVSDKFNSHVLLCLMIKTFKCLSEASFA
jgi:hypothetical protein